VERKDDMSREKLSDINKKLTHMINILNQDSQEILRVIGKIKQFDETGDVNFKPAKSEIEKCEDIIYQRYRQSSNLCWWYGAYADLAEPRDKMIWNEFTEMRNKFDHIKSEFERIKENV
jgi:site-specific DNA-adenine methylase